MFSFGKKSTKATNNTNIKRRKSSDDTLNKDIKHMQYIWFNHSGATQVKLVPREIYEKPENE